MLNQIAIDLLVALRAQLAHNVVVDHGDKSSSGSCRITFSLTKAPVGNAIAVAASQVNAGNNYGPDVDRPRRGRSPPSAPDGNDGSNDPWHSGGGHHDPWSAAFVGNGPATKAPRKNTAHGSPALASGQNYVKNNYGVMCSVTPDPPMLRNRFAFAPARTGTPPIATASEAVGSDSPFDIVVTWFPMVATGISTSHLYPSERCLKLKRGGATSHDRFKC